MDAVVAERAIEFFGDSGAGNGFVRVLAPFDEGQNWRGRAQISWPGFDRNVGAAGVDSWQALNLTLSLVALEIALADDFKAGRIGMFGEKLGSVAHLNEVLGIHPIKGFEQ